MRRDPYRLPSASPESVSPYGGMSEAVGPGGPDYLHIHDYLRIVYRHRWIIIVIMAVGMGAGVAYNWWAPRVFQARATLLVDADPNVLGMDRPVLDQRSWLREYLPTQLGILESRELARMAREELDAARGQAGNTDPAAGVDHGEPTASTDTGRPSVLSEGDIMLGRSVSVVRDTRLINIAFRSTDPAEAADVANALARAYVRHSVEIRTSTSGEASDWLAQQVAEQRKLVEASEEALQRYRETHGADGLLSDAPGVQRQNIVVQKLADLQGAVTLARSDVIEKEAHYATLAASHDNPQVLETLPAVASNASVLNWKRERAELQQQLVQASEQFGERHPEILRLQGAIQNAEQHLQVEIASIVQAARLDLQAARSRERALSGDLERQKKEAQALNSKRAEYTALEREATSNRDMLDRLLQRSRETTLAGQLQSTNVTIVDPARVPHVPVLPREGRNLVLAFAGSGAFALMLILLLEVLNTRLTSPTDVKRHLGVQVVGVTPQVKVTGGHGGPLLSDGAPPQFAELLHGVRTSLLLAPGLSEARTLLVTSSEPGEGKTLSAANLAVSLARLRQRVLLIDADLRRPNLHELFETDREPGLTDVLAGRATHAALRKTKVPDLWVMPAGVAPRNPADILGSERFGILIKCLRDQFDWVVLDSPPVMAVTDPCLIARTTSGVLFVVGSNQTPRDVARAALDQLEAVGANLVGVLLNRASLGKPGESYLPYYHRDYRYYAQPEGTGWIPQVQGVSAETETT